MIFTIYNGGNDLAVIRKKLKKTTLGTKPDFISEMSYALQNVDEIDSTLYPKYNVKRGLRNANGTGVVVGLTKIGEVIGYHTDENKNKIPAHGELYYRGYNIRDLVHSYIKEDRFGFEEVTFLLNFGFLPTKEQLAEFNRLIGMKRELPQGFARDMILTAPSPSIMNKIARSVLALYSYDFDPDNTSIENVLRQSINLIGKNDENAITSHIGYIE